MAWLVIDPHKVGVDHPVIMPYDFPTLLAAIKKWKLTATEWFTTELTPEEIEKYHKGLKLRRKKLLDTDFIPVSAKTPYREHKLEYANKEIISMLRKTGGNVSRAARNLGINRKTVYRRIGEDIINEIKQCTTHYLAY